MDEQDDKSTKVELKLCGDIAVKRKNYRGASAFYSEVSIDVKKVCTQAIELDPSDAMLYSNRSLCYLEMTEAHKALRDANTCIKLLPEWLKGYYRKGAALMSLKEHKEACDAFEAGLKLDLGNTEMEKVFQEAVEAMKKDDLARKTENASSHPAREKQARKGRGRNTR